MAFETIRVSVAGQRWLQKVDADYRLGVSVPMVPAFGENV